MPKQKLTIVPDQPIIRRAFNIYEDQDRQIEELAASVPDFDKSLIVRIALSMGLASLRKSDLFASFQAGTVKLIVDSILQEDKERSKRGDAARTLTSPTARSKPRKRE